MFRVIALIAFAALVPGILATGSAPAIAADDCCASVLDSCHPGCAGGDPGWQAAGAAEGTSPDSPCCPDGCHDCARPCCGGMQAGELAGASQATDLATERQPVLNASLRPAAHGRDIFHPPRS